MSKKSKGRYQPLQSKRKKSRPIPQMAVPRPPVLSPPEETVDTVILADTGPSAAPVSAAMAKTPELVVELRRIGILAAVTLALLIILVFVLG